MHTYNKGIAKDISAVEDKKISKSVLRKLQEEICT